MDVMLSVQVFIILEVHFWIEMVLSSETAALFL